jgi:hypothetical protein
VVLYVLRLSWTTRGIDDLCDVIIIDGSIGWQGNSCRENDIVLICLIGLASLLKFVPTCIN